MSTMNPERAERVEAFNAEVQLFRKELEDYTGRANDVAWNLLDTRYPHMYGERAFDSLENAALHIATAIVARPEAELIDSQYKKGGALPKEAQRAVAGAFRVSEQAVETFPYALGALRAAVRVVSQFEEGNFTADETRGIRGFDSAKVRELLDQYGRKDDTLFERQNKMNEQTRAHAREICLGQEGTAEDMTRILMETAELARVEYQSTRFTVDSE